MDFVVKINLNMQSQMDSLWTLLQRFLGENAVEPQTFNLLEYIKCFTWCQGLKLIETVTTFSPVILCTPFSTLTDVNQ